MKKSKLLNLFLIVAMLGIWSWPELSLAVEIDWFGSKNKDQIIYLKGYNAAMSKIAANLEMPKNTKPVVQPKVVSNLTTSTAYVTNPMTANLDLGGYSLGNYDTNQQIDLDGDVLINGNASVSNVLKFDEAIAPSYVNIDPSGSSGNSILYLESGLGGSSKRYSLFSRASSNSYAGWFDGKVVVDENDLEIEGGTLRVIGASDEPAAYFERPVEIDNTLKVNRLASNAEAIYFDSAVNFGASPVYGRNLNFTTMENNQILLKGLALGSNSTAGHFTAFGLNSYALRSSATSSSSYAGYFEGKVDVIGGLRAANLLVGDFNQNIEIDTPILGVGVKNGVSGISTSWTEGAGVNGNGFWGVHGNASGNQGVGIYGTVASGIENAYAGYFEGKVKVTGNLEADQVYMNDLTVYGHVSVPNSNVSLAKDLFLGEGIQFSNGSGIKDTAANWGGLMMRSNTDVGLIFDANNDDPVSAFRVMTDGTDFDLAKNLFTVNSDGKVGIGIDNPNKQLHIKSSSGNAELDIQSGSNAHWGIYQDNASGNLNFWHGENRVTFSDKGVSAKGFCLDKVCINNWKDLRDILGIDDSIINNDPQIQQQ